MSSVLHPVGPEPRERYWVRRLAVLVAAVVAIGVVIALVGNAMSAGSAVQAEPAPPTVQAPTLPPPTATPTPVTTASPTPGSTPTASPTPGGTPSATPGVTPSATPTAKSSPTPSPTPTAKKSETAKKKAPTKKVTEQPVYATCDGSVLRPTLTGDPRVKTGKKTTLSLSLINGGKKTCTARVSAADATLTVVSGGDRIWSTKDCSKAMPTTKRILLPEHALTWKVTWDGTRSGDGCSTRKEKPKKGYYWAIASFDGADDVRFRIILT